MTPKVIFLQGAAAMMLVTGAFVYHVGAVWVDVREKKPGGDHVRLVVPAIIAPVAAMMVPKAKLNEARYLVNIPGIIETLLSSSKLDSRNE